MKKQFFRIAFFIVLLSAGAYSQNWGDVTKSLDKASRETEVSLGKSASMELRKEFQEWAKTGGKLNEDNTASVMKEYLELKSTTGAENLEQEDIADFNWVLIERNVPLVAMNVRSERQISVKKLVLSGYTISYNDLTITNQVRQIVVPQDQDELIFEMEDQSSAIVSGDAWSNGEPIVFGSIQNSCRIDVTTFPSEAEILFNGKEYHKLSNVNTARPSGMWTVQLKKSGYKEWSGQKVLKNGQQWIICEKLDPEE